MPLHPVDGPAAPGHDLGRAAKEAEAAARDAVAGVQAEQDAVAVRENRADEVSGGQLVVATSRGTRPAATVAENFAPT